MLMSLPSRAPKGIQSEKVAGEATASLLHMVLGTYLPYLSFTKVIE